MVWKVNKNENVWQFFLLNVQFLSQEVDLLLTVVFLQSSPASYIECVLHLLLRQGEAS